MINLDAPIIPWREMGEIKLYSNIIELKNIVTQEGIKTLVFGKVLIRYEIDNKLYLFFNILNGKLFKITALKDYKGKLFENIGIGTPIEDVLKLEPSFEYDEFEEVYVSNKGVFIETDPKTNQVMWISVFIKELETEKFDEANW